MLKKEKVYSLENWKYVDTLPFEYCILERMTSLNIPWKRIQDVRLTT